MTMPLNGPILLNYIRYMGYEYIKTMVRNVERYYMEYLKPLRYGITEEPSSDLEAFHE